MRTKVRSQIKVADKLFSQIIHKRGKCEYCGKTDTLQTAHIIPRTNKNLRWNEDNSVLLCYRHHIHWAHKNPLEFVEWVKTYMPIQYAFLMQEKNRLDTKLGETIEFTIQRLKSRIAELDK